MSLGGWVVLAADRAEPAAFGRRELALHAREAGTRALALVVAPLGWGWAPPRVEGPVDPHRPPILLVPDHRGSRAMLWFLATFLRNRGFGCVWPVNLSPGDRSLSEQAESLAGQVATLRRATGSDRIDIVAHGTGGLAAAWYLRHLDGAANVRRLVTLGTPWTGTRTAVFTGGRIGAEILYGSPLLDGLAPCPVPTTAVWSPDDPVVVPSRSALPDGAESVLIEACGHVEMLTSPRVYRAVHAALTNPLPRGEPVGGPLPEPLPAEML